MRVIVSFQEELRVPSESTHTRRQKFTGASLFVGKRLLDEKESAAAGSQLHYRATVGREDLYVLHQHRGNPGIVDWEDAGTRMKIQIAKALPRLREEILREMEVQCLEVYEAVAGLARFLGELKGTEIREKIEKA